MKKIVNKYIILLLFIAIGIVAAFSIRNKFDSTIEVSEKMQNKIDARYYDDGALYLNEFLKGATAYDLMGDTLLEINQKEDLSTITDDVEIEFEYEIPLKLLYADNKWDGRVRYELPVDVLAKYPSVNGDVKQNDVVVGAYTIVDGIIDIQFFEEQLSEGTSIVGSFYFWANLEYSDVKYSGEKKYEFSNRAVISLQINLFMELIVDKNIVNPVVNYNNNTVDFGYRVKISSPAGTQENININDVFTNAYNYKEYDKLISVSVKLYDTTNKVTNEYNDALSYSDSAYNIHGELPALSPGHYYVLDYVIRENIAYDYYGTLTKNNTITVSLSSGLSVSDTVSSSVMFEGVRHDLSVDKNVSTSQESNDVIYRYSIYVRSNYGTNNEDIDLSDILTYAYRSSLNRVARNYSIYKYSNNSGTNIIDKNYLTFNTDLSENGSSLNETILSGTLPALNANEYYLINYEIVETHPSGSDMTVGLQNNIYVDAGDRSDSDYSYVSTYKYFRPYVYKNTNNVSCTSTECTIGWYSYIRNYYAVSLDSFEFRDSPSTYTGVTHTLDGTVDVKVNYKNGSYQEISDMVFPFKFVTEADGLYLVDGNSSKTKLDYSEGIQYVYFYYDTKVTCNDTTNCVFNSSVYNYSYLYNKDGNRIDSDSAYYNVSFNIKPEDDDDDEDNCDVHSCLFKFELEKLYDGRNDFVSEDYVEFKWVSTIKSINNDDLTPVPYTGIKAGLVYEDNISHNVSGVGTSTLTIDSFFTKDLLSSMTVRNHSGDNLNSSYYDVLVSGYKKNDSGVYEAFNDLLLSSISDNDYITSFKVKFLVDIPYSNATKIVINYSSYLDDSLLSPNEEITIVNSSTFCNTNYISDCKKADAVAYYKKVEDNSEFILTKENYISSSIQNKDYTSVYEVSDNNPYRLYYKVTLNEYSSVTGDVDFNDLLPSGTKLVVDDWSYSDLNCSSSTYCNNGILMYKYSYADKSESIWSGANNSSVNYNEDDNELSIDLLYDSLPDEKGYKLPVIIYYAVDVEPISRDTVYENSATLSDDTSQVTAKTKRKLLTNGLDKEFVEYDTNNNLASFKIVVNENKTILGDGDVVKLNDVISYTNNSGLVNGIELDLIKVFKVENGTEVEVTNELGDFFTAPVSQNNSLSVDITLPDQEHYIVYTYYELLYKDVNSLSDTLTNRVTVTNNMEVNEISASDTGNISESNKIFKSSIYYDVVNNTSEFEIRLNTNSEKINKGSNYSVTDYLSYSGYSSYVESVEVESIVVKDYSSGEIIEMPDGWYTTSSTSSRFYIYMNGFKDQQDYRIRVRYRLKYKTLSSLTMWFDNYASTSIGNSYSVSSSQYVREPAKMTKTSMGYNNKDNTLSYNIKFNSNAEELNDNEDVVLVDKLDFSNYQDIISSVKINSIKVYELVSGGKGAEITDLGDWYSEEMKDGSLIVTMNLPDKKAYYIEYSYKIEFAEYDSINIELTNNLSMDKHSSLAVSSKIVENSKLYKESGIYDEKNNSLSYSVVINSNEETLLDGNDLTVVDELDYSEFASKIVAIKVKDVKLYDYIDGSKGEEITDLEDGWYSETDENYIHTLKVNVKDETAYVLEYTYEFVYDGATLFNASIVNKVYIAGVNGAMWNDMVANVITRYGSRAYAITDAYLLNMTKTDAGDYSKTLSGATYELEKYDGEEWISLGMFTTENDGKVQIGEVGHKGSIIMLMNHLYRLKEIEAPKGYRINPDYQYVYNYNSAFEEELYPEGFDLTQALEIVNSNVYLKDEVEEKNPETNDMLKVGGAIIIFLFSLLLIYLINKKYA